MNIRRYNTILFAITLLLILAVTGMVPPALSIDWSSSDTQLTNSEAWDKAPAIIQTIDGLIWVVWASDRLTFHDDIYYTTSSDYGLNWTSITRLTTGSSFNNMPSIMQTANGSIWIVWTSDRTGDYEIYYTTSPDNGLNWTSPSQFTTNSTSRDLSPSIMQDANGTIWLAWHRDGAEGGNYDIYYKNSTDFGQNWSNETRLTTDPSWDFSPSIIQTRNGWIWVVWSSYRTGDYEIYYKTLSDYGSSWSPPTLLLTAADPEFDQNPSIIQAVDGSICVFWSTDRTGNQDDVYYTTSTDYGESWSPATRLTTDNRDDMDPSITVTDERKMWVVWTSTRTLNFEIFYKTSDAIPIHDVAITDVTPSTTNTTWNETISVSVVVENQGTENETFTVNCYYNSTLIGNQTTTLTNDTSTTLIFLWDPAGLRGTYILSATAATVLGETLPNTSDNTFTDGTVEVVIPPDVGDVDGDGDVDAVDLTRVVLNYGNTPASGGWDAAADLDRDSVGDLDDLYYVLLGFHGF